MCEFSGKLIAWLDRELPAEQAPSVERHLETCSECRGHIDAYKQVSSEFDAYCDEALASRADGGARRWVPVVSAAGAVAALLTLFLSWPRTRIEQPAFLPPQPAVETSSALFPNRIPAPVYPVQRDHRRPMVTRVPIQNGNAEPAPSQNANFLPDEPVIQIAIPADEMFPPGAVPEGMNFAADLVIAADGTADGMRLRPRLASFERRTTEP